MTEISIGSLTLRTGHTKIASSVAGATTEDIAVQARRLKALPVDLVEWRMDYFQGDDIRACADTLGQILGDTPLLATFRTKREGGQRDAGTDAYVAWNETALSSSAVRMIDVEYAMGHAVISHLRRQAKQSGKGLLLSNHDVHATPPAEEMISRMMGMARECADVAKIAVAAQSYHDVRELLSVSLTCRAQLPCPFITIAMGEYGKISRLWGALSGSCVTFAAAGQSSAPGQLPVEDVAHILNLLTLDD